MHEQSDEGVRSWRSSMRVDTRAAGSCNANVAHKRSHRPQRAPSGGTVECYCVPPIAAVSGSCQDAYRKESRIASSVLAFQFADRPDAAGLRNVCLPATEIG